MSDMREAIARTLYECEKRRADHSDRLMGLTRSTMEPWEECKDTFLSDADAILPLLDQARREGAEEMRERAARIAETYGDGEPTNAWEDGGEIASLTICQAIRALPPTP